MTGNDGQARAPVTGEQWAWVRDGEVAPAGTGDRRIRGSSRLGRDDARGLWSTRRWRAPVYATASKPPVAASTTLR